MPTVTPSRWPKELSSRISESVPLADVVSSARRNIVAPTGWRSYHHFESTRRFLSELGAHRLRKTTEKQRTFFSHTAHTLAGVTTEPQLTLQDTAGPPIIFDLDTRAIESDRRLSDFCSLKRTRLLRLILTAQRRARLGLDIARRALEHDHEPAGASRLMFSSTMLEMLELLRPTKAPAFSMSLPLRPETSMWPTRGTRLLFTGPTGCPP